MRFLYQGVDDDGISHTVSENLMAEASLFAVPDRLFGRWSIREIERGTTMTTSVPTGNFCICKIERMFLLHGPSRTDPVLPSRVCVVTLL